MSTRIGNPLSIMRENNQNSTNTETGSLRSTTKEKKSLHTLELLLQNTNIETGSLRFIMRENNHKIINTKIGSHLSTTKESNQKSTSIKIGNPLSIMKDKMQNDIKQSKNIYSFYYFSP
jgi:hypothetical protein